MKAGKLRTKLTIQKLPAAPTRDTIGGEVEDWSAVHATWWCELVLVSGGEQYKGRTVHAEATSLASGRYISGVTAKMRAVLGARVFDILVVDDEATRHRELRLQLKERL